MRVRITGAACAAVLGIILLLTAGCAGTVNSSTDPIVPAIATQPADQSVLVGNTATFSVVANGSAPLTYQWQQNGAAIMGATSASYTTPATTAADNGEMFQVVVTNSAGAVTSTAAKLTVSPDPVPPGIVSQPASQTVMACQTATFSVTSSGTQPLTYQWQMNGSAISGANSANHTPSAKCGRS